MSGRKLVLLAVLAGAVCLIAAGCAPGNERWALPMNRANFWAGLWHGLIIIVTFIVGLFTDTVKIYETNNVGWGYNLGFILGCMMSLGGGIRASTHRTRRLEPDWDRLGRHIADGVREGMKAWVEREQTEEADWDEIGRKIEERVRERLREGRGGGKR